MKKAALSLFSIMLLVGSCAKTDHTVESETAETFENSVSDSFIIIEDSTQVNIPEKTETDNNSENNGQPFIPAGPTTGIITTEQYIYSDYPADNLPMEKLTRTIMNENQVVYVKIQNSKKGETFRVEVSHSNPDGNIAIPHVYGPGLQDGPFGREVNYTVPKDGDYTFTFTRNNRAEGSQLGDISISVIKNN